MKMRIIILVFIFAFLPLITSGQNSAPKSKKITIRGIITDSTGNPIEGARILIDNKTTDVVTNGKGSYKVRTTPDAGMISVFTFNNGVDQISIEGRRTINFILRGIAPLQNKKPGNREQDTEVNIGYGSTKQENITGPVNKLDMKSGKNVFYTDIYQMIAGTVSGVQVNGNSIQIRGLTSITLSNEPLFVVDGIIVDSIDNIDPGEVESIEVLKGAAATIYGSQGAAGVILIQRKGSGKKK